jgi:hypothetical protein
VRDQTGTSSTRRRRHGISSAGNGGAGGHLDPAHRQPGAHRHQAGRWAVDDQVAEVRAVLLGSASAVRGAHPPCHAPAPARGSALIEQVHERRPQARRQRLHSKPRRGHVRSVSGSVCVRPFPRLAELLQDIVEVEAELAAGGCGGRSDPAAPDPLLNGLRVDLEVSRELPRRDQRAPSALASPSCHGSTLGRASGR